MNPQKHPSCLVLASTLLVVALLPFAARADVSWNGSVDTDWANATNWTGGLPSDPGSGNAIVNLGSPNTTPVVSTAGNTTIGEAYLSIGGGLQVVSGGDLSVGSNLITGIWGNSAMVDVSGGALNVGGTLNMGAGGFDGDLNISGGTVTANNLSINSSGGAGMNLGGAGRFVAPISNLGNVNYWVANNNITGFGNTNGWWVNVDTNSQPGQLVLMPAGLVDNLVTTYSNVMNYAGPTIITNNGVLTLAGGDNRLNTGTNVVVHTGTLNLGGNSQTVTGLTGQGTVTNSSGTLTVNLADSNSFGGVIVGAGGVTKTGLGQLTLSGSDSYTGPTVVGSGVLELDSAGGAAAGGTSALSVGTGATLLLSQIDQVNDAAAITLSGGTIRRASGVSEVFGNLTLSSGSFFDYGTGATGTLRFGTYAPADVLTVQNFAQGNVLRFGSDVGSFLPTGGALSNSFFSFNNAFSYDSSTFTITAIPEPSTYAVAVGLLGLMLWPAQRYFVRGSLPQFSPAASPGAR